MPDPASIIEGQMPTVFLEVGVDHDRGPLVIVTSPFIAYIGLAVPGRPIGPWSRTPGAPEASATEWDQTLLGLCWVRSRQVNGGQQRAGVVTKR
jgi:hypothetical protein